MRPRIAIPVPHSQKPDYAQRSLPQYTRAIEEAGGEPVVIPLDREPEEVARLLRDCDAALLPGSPADIDPQKYDAAKDPNTAPADPARDAVDELLLQDAYNLRKPILGICYGLQALNVWRTGTLVQHIASAVNHEAGREVLRAHKVRLEPASRLAGILMGQSLPHVSGQKQAANVEHQQPGSATLRGVAAVAEQAVAPEIDVNSSHHQSADVIGDGLRAVARSEQDGVIEAIEGTAPDHFVVAVQWHPERTTAGDEPSRALFRALVDAAAEWKRTRSAS
jgi:putative glutamine amidotransferase